MRSPFIFLNPSPAYPPSLTHSLTSQVGDVPVVETGESSDGDSYLEMKSLESQLMFLQIQEDLVKAEVRNGQKVKFYRDED
jgi:hypothetical protein